MGFSFMDKYHRKLATRIVFISWLFIVQNQNLKFL